MEEGYWLLHGTMNIIIVDNEDVIKRGIRTIIERGWKREHSIREAENGQEALALVEQEKPDLVITDIRMPCIDGIQLMEQINLRYDSILFIIISGYADFRFAQEGVKQGAIDYLLKPTKPSDIIAALEKAQKILDEREQNQLKIEEFHQKCMEIEELRRAVEAVAPAEQRRPAEKNPYRYRKEIERAVSYIEKNYVEDLSLKQVSEVVFMNPSYFCDLFKRQVGLSFLEYLTKLRIDKAKRLLVERIELKSYEVAGLVGYKDPKYFTQIFKKLVGATPTEYRENEPSADL